MKITHQFVHEWLLNHKKYPLMWAVTQEGFVNPIFLLLSFIGIRTSDIIDARKGNALEVFNYHSKNAAKPVTDEFCIEFIDGVINYLVQDVMES